MAYIDPELIDDETQVAEGVLAALADTLGTPDQPWEASEGHVETAQAEAFAIVAATIAALLLEREREDYAAFGENVLEIARDPATVATVLATFTLTAPSDGTATVPAGYTFVLATPDGEEHAFALAEDLVVPVGETVADATAQALDAGPDPNGATGDPLTNEPVEREDHAILASVTVTTLAGGGADEQERDEYNAEVVRRARRLSALPIAPEGYADYMLDAPAVGRALAVNRQDPATAPADAPGHVTIFIVSPAGDPPTGPELAEQQAYIDDLETVRGTTAHVVAAGTVDADIVIAFRKSADYTAGEAEAAVEAAALAALSRAKWNYDENAAGLWNPVKTELTRYDVSATVDDLPQVDSVTSVTIDGGAGPLAVPATSVLRALTVTAIAS